MPVLLAIYALAAAVWLAVYARRGSLLIGCWAFLVVGYLFGHTFWHTHVGPLAVTFERLLLVALGASFLWQWISGRLPERVWSGSDWLLLLLVGYLTARYIMTPATPAGVRSGVAGGWRLIASFWIPALLYLIARGAVLKRTDWKWFLTGLTLVGLYLTWTAVAEVTGQWWAVFPRYISDPALGTHFGRARGPALLSVSLGFFLTASFWAAWFLWPHVARGWKLVLLMALPAMCVALFFTYTRSTWLGLAGGLAVIPLVQLPSRWRPALLAAGLVVTVAGTLVLAEKMVHMGRDDSDGRADHSVYQRASFMVVSMRMFRDRPIFGCGFARFYDLKTPYLADRSQQLELESIRELDHHNTPSSLLTETGMVGFSLWIALFVAWGRDSWRVFRNAPSGDWKGHQGLFSLAVLIAYLANSMFHDLTLSPSEQWLLFLLTGVTAGLHAATGDIREPARRPAIGRLGAAAGPVSATS